MKYLGVNLRKHVCKLYIGNNKTLMKEIKKRLKNGDIAFS